MKTVIIGGGPAGMMSAISAAENRSPKDEVIIVEKMNMLGKKLLITGKGRCNITSSLEMEDFIKNTPGNGMFLYSSFQLLSFLFTFFIFSVSILLFYLLFSISSIAFNIPYLPYS